MFPIFHIEISEKSSSHVDHESRPVSDSVLWKGIWTACCTTQPNRNNCPINSFKRSMAVCERQVCNTVAFFLCCFLSLSFSDFHTSNYALSQLNFLICTKCSGFFFFGNIMAHCFRPSFMPD